MNRSYSSSLEPLEQRIAPAGLITATFVGGMLTISGADGQDHDVEVVKTGLDRFSVQGTGTDINELGQSSVAFRGVLKGIDFIGGSGGDNLSLTNLPPVKTLNFNGGDGVDSLSTTNFKLAKRGTVDIDLGAESGKIEFAGDRTIIRGALNMDLGGGGEVSFLSAVTKVRGNATVTGGSQSDSVSVGGGTTLFKRSLTFLGGDGNDSFSATGQSFRVKGDVTMDGAAGTNQFLFAADVNSFGTRLTDVQVDVKIGVGPGSAEFMGDVTKLRGDLKLDLGSGGSMAHLGSTSTTIRDSMTVTGGAGNDTLKIEGRTSIGQDLIFNGAEGDDTLTATGDLFTVGRALTVDSGTGAGVVDVSVVELMLGSLSVTGGASNDTVSIVADGRIAGDVNLALGGDGIGPSGVVLRSAANITNGLRFGGDLTISMLGATVDTLAIANIQVAKNFTAQTGENVSTVDIVSLNAIGNFRLETGAGADVVNIDNINARDFYVDTQAGADELRIERNTQYRGPSHVTGVATILTGIGADQIRIGDDAGVGNPKVIFEGAMTLDAGDGANMRNDIRGSNTFKSEPTITATDGTLTQTEAV